MKVVKCPVGSFISSQGISRQGTEDYSEENSLHTISSDRTQLNLLSTNSVLENTDNVPILTSLSPSKVKWIDAVRTVTQLNQKYNLND
ncbi:unnamed protein product [Didymodactylos carnosus]|uniref:Uncharacterized protein n=1 Tax=Didymodactylos carnosus TaxID=1234261 RepID=A0A813QYE5_9BILA|nr:unnamed protein product [Didymodactylos carnosus]CAF3556245.1 unnamed protein product [Didymodactylos carnosus]